MKRSEVKRHVQAVTMGNDGYQVVVWVQYRRFVAGERGGNAKQDVWAVADDRANWYDRTPRQLAHLDPERKRLCAELGCPYDSCFTTGELRRDAILKGQSELAADYSRHLDKQIADKRSPEAANFEAWRNQYND